MIFNLDSKDPNSKARAGTIKTDHGLIHTPIFMPVGTSATLKDFHQATSIIDLVYLLITILSLIKCYKKGFVLSILSMAKWLMAYVITLILFPRLKPYFKNK